MESDASCQDGSECLLMMTHRIDLLHMKPCQIGTSFSCYSMLALDSEGSRVVKCQERYIRAYIPAHPDAYLRAYIHSCMQPAGKHIDMRTATSPNLGSQVVLAKLSILFQRHPLP